MTLDIDYERILKIIHKCENLDTIKDITNSVNKNQLKNKELLLERLQKYISFYETPKISIAAGWHGLLAHLLNDKENVLSFDIDPKCKETHLFDNVRYKTMDINLHNPRHYDINICTACEHMSDEMIIKWIRKKKKDSIIVLQSNNYFGIKDHINCKKSIIDWIGSLSKDYSDSNHSMSTITIKEKKYTIINKWVDKFPNYSRFTIVIV